MYPVLYLQNGDGLRQTTQSVSHSFIQIITFVIRTCLSFCRPLFILDGPHALLGGQRQRQALDQRLHRRVRQQLHPATEYILFGFEGHQH